MSQNLRICRRPLGRLLTLLGLLLPLAGWAQYLTPGNLVVLQVDGGSVALTSTATPVSLREYTPTGTLVGTPVLLNSTGAGNKLTNSGSAGSEGHLSRSVDGRYLLLQGYNVTAGTTGVVATVPTATTNQRVIGRVDVAQTANLSTALTNVFSANNIRSSASTDGTTLYAAGPGATTPTPTPGVVTAALGSTTATAFSPNTINTRVVNIYGGVVYYSTASSYAAGALYTGSPALSPGIVQVSSPTSVSQLISTGTGASPYGYVLFDTDATPGPDLAYIADDRAAGTGGVQKWFLVGGTTWTLKGTFNIGSGARGVTASLNTTTATATVYATNSATASALVSFVDASGYNAFPGTAPTVTTLVTPTGFTAFRDVSFVPVGLRIAQGTTTYADNGTPAYDFGNRAISAGTSPAVTFTVTNTAAVAATITSITTTGPFATSGTIPASVAAYSGGTPGSATFALTFTPTAGVAYTGTAVVTYTTPTGATGTYTVNLAGTGTVFAQSATVTQGATTYPNLGAAYNFGTQNLNTASSPVTFTITNNEAMTRTINSIVPTGDFAISGATPSMLPGSGTATFALAFVPPATGTRTGTVVINYTNGSGTGNYTVNLTGTGVADPSIAVSQGATPLANNNSPAFAFASTNVGSGSSPVTFTISNTGPDDLTLTGFTASGTEFTATGTNPTTVVAGGTATFQVGFQPSATGTRTGTITIANNSQATPSYVLNFTGMGLAAPVSTFEAARLKVLRVGDGSTPLTSAAFPVFVDEFNSTANQTMAINTLALPTADAGTTKAITVSGTSTSDGAFARSVDGQYLTLAGYNAVATTATVVGTPGVTGTSAANNPRVVARIDINNAANVTTVLTGAFSGNNARSAVTSNGINIWAVGNGTGVVYSPLGGTAPTVVSSNVTNTRVVNIFDGQLYFASGSSVGISKVGTGRPTTAGSTSSLIAASPTLTSPYGFVMLERDASVVGLDVLYVVDDGGGSTPGIFKFSKDNTNTWTLRGKTIIPAGYRGLTGRVNSTGVVELYLSGSPGNSTTVSNVVGFSDATGKDAGLGGTATLTTLATAAANTVFRGVAFAPETLDLVADATTGPVDVDGGTYRNVTASVALTTRGDLTANGTTTVSGPAASLRFGTGAAIKGTGSFALGAGSTLNVNSPDGITASSATGNVQTTTRSFSPGADYVYNGTAAQTTGDGLPATVRNLTVNNATGLTLTNAVAVSQRVQLRNGNLATGAANNLTLLSTPGFSAGPNAGRTALLDNRGNNVVTGTANVMQRAVDNVYNGDNIGYHHFSSPMTGTTLGDLSDPGFAPVFNDATGSPAFNATAAVGYVRPFPTVLGYDQSRVGSPTLAVDQTPFNQGYFAGLSAATTWVPGTAYAVNSPNAVTLDFTGQFNNAPTTTAFAGLTGLARNGNADGGWQLLGNPFPAPLNFALVNLGTQTTNLDPSIYQYHSTSRYGGYFTTYQGNAMLGTQPTVPAGGGFFMRVTAPGTSTGALRLTNANRDTTYANQASFGRATASTRPLLTLTATAADGTADALTLYGDARATAAFDPRFDAAKLPNPNGLNLAARVGSEFVTIAALPAFTAATVVPLALGVPAAGTYTLAATELANFGSTRVYLRDAATGTDQLLSAGTQVRLTLASATAGATRYALVFRPAGALATAPNALAAQATVYPNPAHDRFTLTLPPVAGQQAVRAALVNALGQVVDTRTVALPAAGTTAEYATSGLAAGVYSLRLTAGNQAATLRVVVQ